MPIKVNNITVAFRLAALAAFIAFGATAEAGIFGVPSNIGTTGQLCTGNNTPAGIGCTALAIDPPGWFILTGTTAAVGDNVHQIRFFIEVTGTSLDVRIFDPGSSGARDAGTAAQTTYTLISPSAATIATVNLTNDVAATTQDRLARLTAGGFVAANAGAAFVTTPGLYELRVAVTAVTANMRNAFGVDVRDGSGNPYNVYTIGEATAPASAFVAGRWAGTAPIAEVSASMPLFSYVDRGCSVIPSNFHAENAGPATIIDGLGQSTSLTLSNTGAVAQTLTVETTTAVNQDSTNYGMWPLTHAVTTGSNIVDWRVADYRGWTTAPSGTLPGDPAAAIRTYLPNSYAPAGGNPNAVAPNEPILRSVFGVVSGPNPPIVGSATRIQITTALYNAGPGAISNVILQTPLPATGALVAGSAVASIDGVTATCTEPGGVPGFLAGTTALQCTFTSPVPLDSVATLEFRVDITPAALGLLSVTGRPSLALSGLTRTGTAATATTASPHWFALGDSVTIGSVAPFNITALITAVTSPTTFTYTVANSGALTSAGGTVTENGGDRSAVALFTPAYSKTTPTTISGLARVTTTATATTAVAHGLAPGDSVTIAGSVAPFNGTFIVLTVPSTTTFTYAVANSGAVASAAGTVTQQTRSENAGPICQLTGTAAAAASVPVNLGITKTESPDPVAAGADITYTITVTNPAGGNAAPNASMVDVLPSETTFQSLVVAAGWTCSTPAVGGGGTVSCTRVSFPANTISTFTLTTRVALSTPDATIITNTATVASGGVESNPANNSATATTTVGSTAPTCATGATGSPASISGVVNAYYPGTGTVANGATSITVGARLGAATDITSGDLLLIIQMQDAAIDSTNTAAYGGAINGTTNLNNVGRYEYAVATNTVGAAGGTINLRSGLTRGPYTNANLVAGTQGQRRFQVVRVPQYASTTLTSGLTALPWNGAVGGILAVDVSGNLALGGATVNVSGLGFRAGLGRALTGGAGSDTDYRNPAAQNIHGSKGEGIAGTPRYLWSATGGAVDTTIDGYPNGSSGRGRPGNAGGGGTDDDVPGNTQNSGGGGGGNAGTGGRGGNSWNTNQTLGGLGGAAFAIAADRLVLGGGGGAGSRNNSTTEMSSGGAGGGMVFLRAGSVTGTGTIIANGQMGVQPNEDGGGGGGAGGSVLVLAVSSGLGGLTVNAQGAAGTNAWPTQAPGGTPGERHGPGGGGGGGAIVLSSAAAATDVTGGAAGTTTTAADTYNALAGGVGSVTISPTLDAIIPAVCTVAGSADLAVTKTADPDTVLAGSDITYTIQVQNLGPSASANATLSESVPANTTFQSLNVPAGWSCASVPAVGGAGSFTCSIASLASGGSATFTYVVRINLSATFGTVVANTATVSSTTPDPNAANNTASAFTSVEPFMLLTRATIAGLRIEREGRVRFATGTQHGTRQFDLYASNDRFRASDLRQLNREPVQAPIADSRGPILYDVQTDPIASRYLYLVETERSGRRNVMGPFPIDDARLAAAYDRIEKSLSEEGSREVLAQGAQRARILASREQRAANPHFRATIERLREQKESRRSRRRGREGETEGVKIAVSQRGRVQVTRAELAAQGLPGNVPLQSVRVTSLGRAVAATLAKDGSSLAFEAEALHTTYTGDNVYVLSWRGVPTPPRVPLSMVDPVAAGMTRINKRGVYFVYSEGIDPWVWDVLSGPVFPDPSWDPEAGTFDLPGLVPSTLPAPFALKVAGYSDHTHIVEAWLNGQALGEVRFEGQASATLRGTVKGLQATGNRLTLSYQTVEGDPNGFAVLSHLDLGVPLSTGAVEATIEDISPFSTALPSLANIDTLVVTHSDFANTAQRFAALKKAEGRRVAVVDVDRAYDAFSAGVVEAQSVRALIQKAAKVSDGLRYVVLVGDDTFDPENFSGLGDVSFVPSLYGPGRVPTENGYADLDGDGRADLAIGRLPVHTVEEAETLVDKIARQTLALRASVGRHLLAVDNGAGETNQFLAEAQTVAAQLPAGSAVSLADVGTGIEAARSAVEAGFASGAFVHYFGHGGPGIWADEQLLDVAAVQNLAGAGSVVLTWACQVQDYQYIYGPSVNEALVLKPQGGALAAFGPAGITDQAEQALLYQEFYKRMRAGGSLGEIIRDAKAAAVDLDPRARAAAEGFNLLGDPSLVIPAAPAASRPRVP